MENVQGVLVTGAGSGVGRVVAERFADGGARVAICDSDPGTLARIRAERPDIVAVQADMASAADIDRLFEAVAAHLPRLDVLVNNVGIAGPTAMPEDITLDDWNKSLAVNLTSHFLCARHAIPAMKARGAGVIVNLSSGAATVGLPMRLPYVVTKTAILGLTRNLARELGPFGIRVNAILPGPVAGERIRRVIASKAAALGIEEAEYEARMVRFVSMRSLTLPEDIAEMICFLASPAAARITGQLIGVDGNLEFEE